VTLPDCTRCDASKSLEAIRADAKGYVWAYCSVCSHTHLVNAEGRIVRTGEKQ
jgi:hypothetical protein